MKKVCLEIMQIHFGLQKQSIEVGQTKMRKTMSSCTTIQSVEYGMPPRMVCRHQRQNTLQAVGGNCDLALIVNRNNRPPHSLLPDLVEEFQRRVHQCLCTHVKEGRGGGICAMELENFTKLGCSNATIPFGNCSRFFLSSHTAPISEYYDCQCLTEVKFLVLDLFF